MLPVHRSLPSEGGLSSCLSKRPPFVQSKPSLHWLAFACVVTVLIWLGDSLILNRSELLLHASDSPNTTTATTYRFHRPSIVSLPPTKEEQDIWQTRKNEVRNAFKHAWSGYKSIAYPNDELLSLSGGQSNKFFCSPSLTFLSTNLYCFLNKRYNGWGVTLFDSLDTLWIMGLRDEFADAVDDIRDQRFHATKVSQRPL